MFSLITLFTKNHKFNIIGNKSNIDLKSSFGEFLDFTSKKRNFVKLELECYEELINLIPIGNAVLIGLCTHCINTNECILIDNIDLLGNSRNQYLSLHVYFIDDNFIQIFNISDSLNYSLNDKMNRNIQFIIENKMLPELTNTQKNNMFEYSKLFKFHNINTNNVLVLPKKVIDS